MIKIWKKTKENKNTTEWVYKKDGLKKKTLAVTKDSSLRKFGYPNRWIVGFFNHQTGYSNDLSFPIEGKQKALKYAKAYMKKHPKG